MKWRSTAWLVFQKGNNKQTYVFHGLRFLEKLSDCKSFFVKTNEFVRLVEDQCLS